MTDELVDLIVRLGQENRRWGCVRIPGELRKLGIRISATSARSTNWRLEARFELPDSTRFLEMPLISADKRLLGAGLAESPAQVVRRLRLPMPR